MKKESETIALWGTSADPPTLGHEILLKGLLKLFPKVVTWVSDNPIKTHCISIEKRVLLLTMLVESINNNNLELIQEISSPFTIQTLERAIEIWPRKNFVFIIGSDLIAQVPTWLDAKIVAQKTRFAIVPRKGWPTNELEVNELKSIGGKIDFLPLNVPATASSEARTKLGSKQIPLSIRKIALKENLYGSRKDLT